jgi:hypothetical protein
MTPSESRMRENRTSGSMRRGERRVMVSSANGHRTRKGGNGGAPQDLDTTALALHSTERTRGVAPTALTACGSVDERVAKARGAGMRSRASVKA